MSAKIAPFTRMKLKEQSAEDRYSLPENFLEIEVKNPQTHGEVMNIFFSSRYLYVNCDHCLHLGAENVY
jgi:hypothetical protein